MSAARYRRRRTVGAASIVLAVLALLAIGPMIGVASAHSKLVSTSPANGAVLGERPVTVEFTFDENLLTGTNTISINDDQGNVVATTPVEPDGRTISAPWPARTPNGTYQVAYRIVSADGHPVSGAITFTVDATGPASTTTEPAPGSASPPAASQQAPEVDSSGSTGWVVAAIVVATVALALLAIAVLRARRRRGVTRGT